MKCSWVVTIFKQTHGIWHEVQHHFRDRMDMKQRVRALRKKYGVANVVVRKGA